MTNPLSIEQKVDNIRNRLSQKFPFIDVDINYFPNRDIVTFTCNDKLVIKCIISNDGKSLQVVKGYSYLNQNIIISWKKFEGLGIEYINKNWKQIMSNKLDDIAQEITDAAEMDVVLEFFHNEQRKWLETLTYDEVVEQASMVGIYPNKL